MKKQNTQVPSGLNSYLIPHLKSKLSRAQFKEKANQWLSRKLGNLTQNNTHQPEPTLTQQHKNATQLKKKYQSLRKQLSLKYPFQDIVSILPFQYFQTIVFYVMQKKLHWVFKPSTESLDQDIRLHKQQQVSLNLTLKKMYKDFQLNIHQHNNSKISNMQKSYSPQTSFYALNSPKRSTRKMDSNFQYNLLLILSVYLVSRFFEDFFTEIKIDDQFRSQCYIILNHAFLDLQVSPNVFEIMKKKYTFQPKIKEYPNSILGKGNEKILKESRYEENGVRKATSRKGTTFDMSSIINPSESKPSMQKILPRSRGDISSRQISNEVKYPVSIQRMNTTGFSSLESGKILSKNSITVKPLNSLQQSVSMKSSAQKRSKFRSKQSLHKNKSNHSRFNSFLKGAKQFNVPSILQETFGQNYLPSPEVIEFYTTIKNYLHVNTLPPIVKKKLNINQYEKLNELGEIDEIKQQVRSLDILSKKNHMKSNDLSLAMNTFISASGKIPKKKRHQTNFQVIRNQVDNQNEQDQNKQNASNRSNIQDKQNQQTNQSYDLNQTSRFELQKLPIKSSNIKLHYQKSANIYQFSNEITKIKSKTSKKQTDKISTTFSLASKKKLNQTQSVLQEQKEIEKNLLDKKNKNPNDWKNYLDLLRKHQSKENIASFSNQQDKKSQHKKSLHRRSYLTNLQNEKNYCISMSNSLLGSSYQLKINDQKSLLPRQSILQNKIALVNHNKNHSSDNLRNLHDLLNQHKTKDSEGIIQVQLDEDEQKKIEEISKFYSLQGRVNIHNQKQVADIKKYECFQIKKRFRQFENSCRLREQKINYSMFNINNINNINISLKK